MSNQHRKDNFNLILCLSKHASEIIPLRRGNQIEKEYSILEQLSIKNQPTKDSQTYQQNYSNIQFRGKIVAISTKVIQRKKSAANQKFQPGIDVNLDQAEKRDKFSFRLRNK